MIFNRMRGLFKTDTTSLFFFCIFCLFVVAGLFLPYFLSTSPNQVNGEFLKAPPFWMEGGTFQFIFGTDDLGRDLFVRLIYGTRISLAVGTLVVFISLLVGVTLGLIAGYFRGRADQCIMRFVDMLMSFPAILIAILIVTVLGPSLMNAIIAVSVTIWPSFIRVVRSVVLKERERDYVQVAKGIGAGRPRILWNHLLPNCVGPIIVQSTLGFSEGILNVAALSFLGLGVQPPIPEWGIMISDGRPYMETAWWLITLPGLFLLTFVLSVNILGESLRDVFDTKTI